MEKLRCVWLGVLDASVQSGPFVQQFQGTRGTQIVWVPPGSVLRAEGQASVGSFLKKSSFSCVSEPVMHGPGQAQLGRDILACAGVDLWLTKMPCDNEYTCANWKDRWAQA